MNDNTVIVKSEKVLTTEIDDELGLMNIDKGLYFTLNHTGKRIWELIETDISIKDLTKKLIEEYTIGYEECIKEVSELLDIMKNNNLVDIKS